MQCALLLAITILGALLTGVFGQNITCTENEIYTNCLSPCVPTCQIPYTRNCQFLVCNPGCLCKPGFKKDYDSNGKCVPEATCQSYCKPKQKYRECGPDCIASCSNKTPMCDKVCTAGCFCEEGWIWFDLVELCVLSCPNF